MPASRRAISLEQLTARHVEGDPEPDDEEALGVAWTESPEVRASLATQQRIDRLLLGARPGRLDLDRLMAALPARPGHATDTVMSRLNGSRRARKISKSWMTGAAAAATAVVLALGWIWMVAPAIEKRAQTVRPENAVVVPTVGAPQVPAPKTTAGTATPPRPVVPAQARWPEMAPPGVTVLRFDFEGRAQDRRPWTMGRIVTCPPSARGRSCIRGERMVPSDHPHQYGVTLGDWKKPLFAFTGGETLAFSYWIGQTTGRDPAITVDIHGDDGRTYNIVVPTGDRVRWVRVAAPLSAARAYHTARPLARGESIRAVHITLRWAENDVFLVDDVAISRASPH